MSIRSLRRRVEDLEDKRPRRAPVENGQTDDLLRVLVERLCGSEAIWPLDTPTKAGVSYLFDPTAQFERRLSELAERIEAGTCTPYDMATLDAIRPLLEAGVDAQRYVIGLARVLNMI